MKSQVINHKMKSFETTMNPIAQGTYIVARLNSLGLTRHDLEAMMETSEHLMTCGFNVTYAHVTHNEISLLFDIGENSYGRNAGKFISILAAEASAKLTQITGDLATFESRILALPNKNLVVDYFQSRAQHTGNSWSYWKTGSEGRRDLVTIRSSEINAELVDALN